MKTKTFSPLYAVAFFAIIITAFLAACSPGSVPATEPVSSATDPAVVSVTDQPVTDPVVSSLDGATLMDERCSVCHSTTRITSESMTIDEWTTVVDRMINKGADLSADERQVLIDYLAATYK